MDAKSFFFPMEGMIYHFHSAAFQGGSAHLIEDLPEFSVFLVRFDAHMKD